MRLEEHKSCFRLLQEFYMRGSGSAGTMGQQVVVEQGRLGGRRDDGVHRSFATPSSVSPARLPFTARPLPAGGFCLQTVRALASYGALAMCFVVVPARGWLWICCSLSSSRIVAFAVDRFRSAATPPLPSPTSSPHTSCAPPVHTPPVACGVSSGTPSRLWRASARS
jgi:hypothetical protein